METQNDIKKALKNLKNLGLDKKEYSEAVKILTTELNHLKINNYP